jgi:hypothetical protein
LISNTDEPFDIENLMHKKLSLELLRGHIAVLKEILSRNQGKSSYEKTPNVYIPPKDKPVPTIEESINLFFKHYTVTAVNKDLTKKQVEATKNFLYDVTLHFLKLCN